jgi:hypothetical protein
MRPLGRMLAATLLACSTAAALSGCFHPLPPPTQTISAWLGDEGVEFAICEQMHVKLILVEYQVPNDEWIVLVNEEVDQRAEIGDSLDLPNPDGLPDLTSLEDGTILHILVHDGERVAESRFVLERGVWGDHWLTSEGSKAPDPCPNEP